MAKFQKRELGPPKKSRPLRTPDVDGKWTKVSEGTALPPGAQGYAVSVTGFTKEELEAKIEEVETSGREFLINVIPKDVGQLDKWGKVIQPRPMHPLFVDRHSTNPEGKPYVVLAVELPQWERERLAEKNRAKIEEAKKLIALEGGTLETHAAPAGGREADEAEVEPG